MSREDISNYLVHWTRGDTYEAAFDTLRSIVFSHRLFRGSGSIKGGFECICFTEAPVEQFHRILGRYKPFGVRVSKKWLYQQGGRPVIYESDEEYELLPDEIRWRHVRYEPHSDPPIDFTWEREWRIQTNELGLPPSEVVLILPGDEWADLLEREHLVMEDDRIQMEAFSYGEWAEYQTPDPFHYAYSIINV